MKFSVMVSAVAMMALAACAQSGPPVVWRVPPKLDQAPDGKTVIEVCGAIIKKPIIEPAPLGTPPNVAAFLGQWGDGHQTWNSYIYSTCGVLFVTAVTPDGFADVLEVAGRTDSSPPMYVVARIRVDGNYLVGNITRYFRSGNELRGMRYMGQYTKRITLPRVAQSIAQK